MTALYDQFGEGADEAKTYCPWGPFAADMTVILDADLGDRPALFAVLSTKFGLDAAAQTKLQACLAGAESVIAARVAELMGEGTGQATATVCARLEFRKRLEDRLQRREWGSIVPVTDAVLDDLFGL